MFLPDASLSPRSRFPGRKRFLAGKDKSPLWDCIWYILDIAESPSSLGKEADGYPAPQSKARKGFAPFRTHFPGLNTDAAHRKSPGRNIKKRGTASYTDIKSPSAGKIPSGGGGARKKDDR